MKIVQSHWGRFKGYIGHHGDFSIFSFGLYKFISTPLGGLIKTKSKKIFKII